jgi:dTDP-glucose 4,6-dehydratase
VERQLKNLNEVIVIDNETYASNRSNISEASWKRIKFHKIDIADAEGLKEVLSNTLEIDWIVNFAAESHVDRSIHSSTPFFRTNINGVINILDYLVQFPDINFLQVSTDEVYGSITSGSWSEVEPLMPNSPYSASKASAELICYSYNKTFGVKVITTRCANNFGPNQALEKLIPKVIHNLSRKTPIDVYGDGRNVREWLYVEDHVSVLSSIISAKSTKSFTYNIGGEAMSNLSLIQKIGELMNVTPNINFVIDRLGHDFRYSVDDSLVKSEFSVGEFINLEERLESTIFWYLENPEWVNESIRKINL